MKVTSENILENYKNGFATLTKDSDGSYYCYSFCRDNQVIWNSGDTEEDEGKS